MIEHISRTPSEGGNRSSLVMVGAGALLSLATIPLAGGIIYHRLRGENDEALDLAKAATFPFFAGPTLTILGMAHGRSYAIGPQTEIRINDTPISSPIHSEEHEQSVEPPTKPQA